MILAGGLAMRPAAGVAALLKMPEIWASGDIWPAAIPCGLMLLLLGAGLDLCLRRRGPLAWLRGCLWLLGAGLFADVPLRAAGWHWPSLLPLFAVVVALDLAAVAWGEWRYREPRPIVLRLAVACLLPFLEDVTGELPAPLFYAHAVVATAILVSCVLDSLTRYRPRRQPWDPRPQPS